MTQPNLCRSTHRSEGCPSLSDSESDEEAVNIDDRNSSEKHEKDEHAEPDCFVVDHPAPEGTRTESIEKLKTNADLLQVQIAEFTFEKERVQENIREKKRLLFDAILKVVEYEKSIQAVEAVIADKLHHFQTRMVDLETKRMEIFLECGDGKVRELLEREIKEVKEEFEQRSKVADSERDQLTQQAQQIAASLGDVIDEFKGYAEEMMLKVKAEKSEEELEAMKTKFNDDMTQLTRLINRPAQFCFDKSGNRFYVNVNKEKVFKIDNHSSDYKLSVDGVRERIKDGFKLDNDENGEFFIDLSNRKIYIKYYFEDEFGRFFIDVHGHRHYQADPEASEYMLVNGNWKKIKDGTYETDERGLRLKPKSKVESVEQVFDMNSGKLSMKTEDDDLKYIKEAVGPAIRKALAAVVIHQPADPINYFANFLLNYRYNQCMFEKRDEELKINLELREEMKESGKDYQ